VKVRYAPFDTVTHGTSVPPGERFPPGILPPPTDQLPLGDQLLSGDPSAPGRPDDGDERWAATIERGAQDALAMFTPGRPVRLLGVRAEFADNPD
jgi:hypothetical protein